MASTTTKAERVFKADLIARKLMPYAKWLLAHKFGLKAAADKHGVSCSTMRAALDKVAPDIRPKEGVTNKPIGHDTRQWSLIQHYVMTNQGRDASADEIAYDCHKHIEALCHAARTAPIEVSPHCIIAACEAKHLPTPRALTPPPKNLI